MSCMKPIGDEKQCPYCGYHVDSPQLSPYLPIKSVVANRYLVGKVLDFNGDGVTYAGWDLTERVAVKVREFLPDAICSRENGETQTVLDVIAVKSLAQSGTAVLDWDGSSHTHDH